MKIEPSTKVSAIYCALPSSASVLRLFGISVDSDADATLSEVAARQGFSLDDLMSNLQNLACGKESSSG